MVLLHSLFYHLELKTGSFSEAILVRNPADFLWAILSRVVYKFGSIGVPIFFIISGFIITTLLEKEEQRNGAVNLAAFYVRRSCRILPAMLLLVAVVAVISQFGLIKVGGASIFAASTFTCNIVQCDWWLAHYWSLAFEEQFYLVWPAAFAVLGFARRLGASLAIAAALILVSFVIPYLSAIAYLAIGVCFALLQRRKPIRLPKWVAPTALCGIIIQSVLPVPAEFGVISHLADLVFLPSMFFGSMYNNGFKWVINRGWLAAIGRASYGLYLWQQIFLAPKAQYLVDYPSMSALLLPLVVWVSYRFFELPIMTAGRRLSDRLQRRSFDIRSRRPGTS